MSITAGTTARGLPYPGHASAADVPTHIKALADAIEAMMNSPLVLGSTLTALTAITASGTGTSSLILNSSSSGADLKRSRLLNDTGVTRLQSVNDAFSTTKTGLTLDHATGVVDHPNGFTGRRVDSPYFRAFRSSAASYAVGATVAFNTETDPNGWYDNTTGIFLPTVAGMYRVSWRITTNVLSSGNYFYGSLSGFASPDTGGRVTAPATSGPLSSSGSTLVAMNGTTDLLGVIVVHNQGGSLALATGADASHFEAERIGA